jgi:tRNA(Ile)-lysidine synthase
MDASVLPLSWPADFDPLDHKRFETDARTLRYQALGRACRAESITSLLVAHHADDQAETVLMRLANNRLRSGLQAMQPIEWIPECFGIHGVYHSGASGHHLPAYAPFPVEQGGVHILRPLLGFEKERLIATCEEQGVAWAEDKTNHLQTYTSRNAIRHVLKNHKLPAALSIKSLVDVSLNMQKRVNSHKMYAQRLLKECLIKLNIQAGSLLIRFPPFENLLSRPIETQSDMNEAKNNAYYLLERVGQLIAPREAPPLSELAATLANIWPEFLKLEEVDSSQAGFSGNRANYCVYSIWWRKWDRPSIFSNFYKTSGGSRRVHAREWLLTRQPLENHRPGASSETIHYPPSHVLSLTPQSGASNEFQLFDGRWWIRIQNHTTDTLTLRLFTKDDIRHIPSLHNAKRISHTGDPRPERFIGTALSLLKPADLRFTLPAVFRHDEATGEETLVGFPTLNVSMGTLGFPRDVCAWQVRYKKIELGRKQLDDIVAPGITHAMIEKEMAKFETKDSRPKTSVRTEKARMKESRDRLVEERGTKIHKTEKNTRSPGKTIPLIPVAESQRHGKSEKREGGGYNIKWEDFKDRFS